MRFSSPAGSGAASTRCRGHRSAAEPRAEPTGTFATSANSAHAGRFWSRPASGAPRRSRGAQVRPDSPAVVSGSHETNDAPAAVPDLLRRRAPTSGGVMVPGTGSPPWYIACASRDPSGVSSSPSSWPAGPSALVSSHGYSISTTAWSSARSAASSPGASSSPRLRVYVFKATRVSGSAVRTEIASHGDEEASQSGVRRRRFPSSGRLLAILTPEGAPRPLRALRLDEIVAARGRRLRGVLTDAAPGRREDSARRGRLKAGGPNPDSAQAGRGHGGTACPVVERSSPSRPNKPCESSLPSS